MIGTIIVFGLIPVIALVANAIEDYSREVPFNSVYEESGLPIVTLSSNDKEFNFLVDTGANLSLINITHLDDFNYTRMSGQGTIFGMEGNVQKVEYVKIKLSHEKNDFDVEFQVVNMDSAFNKIERVHGVLIHGVLGTEFLESNKGKIDFIEHKLIYGKPKKDKAALKGQNE